MIMKQWCVLFHDGSGKVVLGHSKEHIRQKFNNVKSVFEMGRKT